MRNKTKMWYDFNVISKNKEKPHAINMPYASEDTSGESP